MEHLPNVVEPKRSEGVPKETPERNSLRPIAHTLSRTFPDANWGSLAAISRADYFAAGMQEQLLLQVVDNTLWIFAVRHSRQLPGEPDDPPRG